MPSRGWIFETLLDPADAYFHLADLGGYLRAQEQAAAAFRDTDDRAVAEGASDIWGIAGV